MEATVASVGEMVQGQSTAQAQAQQQLEAQYQALLRQKEQQAQDERDKVRRGVGGFGEGGRRRAI
jgi:vacuolar-type H+-ATPase subunit H